MGLPILGAFALAAAGSGGALAYNVGGFRTWLWEQFNDKAGQTQNFVADSVENVVKQTAQEKLGLDEEAADQWALRAKEMFESVGLGGILGFTAGAYFGDGIFQKLLYGVIGLGAAYMVNKYAFQNDFNNASKATQNNPAPEASTRTLPSREDVEKTPVVLQSGSLKSVPGTKAPELEPH